MMHLNEPAAVYTVYENASEIDQLEALKSVSGLSDQKLSDYLHVSEKSLRTYRKEPNKISLQLREHLLLLKVLYDLGLTLFSDKKAFQLWLSTPNFFFDDRSPEYYLTTITGIRFVYDRLMGMQSGDNV